MNGENKETMRVLVNGFLLRGNVVEQKDIRRSKGRRTRPFAVFIEGL